MLQVISWIVSLLPAAASAFDANQELGELRKLDVKVPVQLGVMSRCPDARICEPLFNEVLPAVQDKIILSAVYIATFNQSAEVFGLTCLHGPSECAGNVQQLCVHKYADAQTWWNFVACQNEQSDRVGEGDLALECSEKVGLNWAESGAGTCAGLDGSGTGEEGIALFKENVQLGKDLDLRTSCTVVINRKSVCIHDKTWKDCDNGHEPQDFIRQIDDEYEVLNRAV